LRIQENLFDQIVSLVKLQIKKLSLNENNNLNEKLNSSGIISKVSNENELILKNNKDKIAMSRKSIENEFSINPICLSYIDKVDLRKTNIK
jgi:hypothetical protein